MCDKTICFVGPSGVGKTSYIKRLVEKYNFYLPIVVTTRIKRVDDNERYQYVTESIFQEMVNLDLFLEWDKYSGYYYGTLFESVCSIPNTQKNSGIILDLTPEGCRKVLNKIPTAIILAIFPDNPCWLFDRLIMRNSQTTDEIVTRTKLLEDYLNDMRLLNSRDVFASFSPESWDKTFECIEKIVFESDVQ